MLTEEDFHRFTEFRCGAMGRRLREMVEDVSFDSMTFEEKMKDLIETEVQSRQENKIAKLVKKAGFKIPDACVEDVIYLRERNLSKDRILRLAQCAWVDECGTVAIISKTSRGKSYLAQALGTAACRNLHDVKYTRLPDICTELNQARESGDGTYYELINMYKRTTLLIIDDFMTTPIATVNAIDLFEIMEAREGRRATLIASQLEPNEWYLRIEGELMADSILSRIATGAPTDCGTAIPYYSHVMRVEQKLAYLYGWQTFLDDTDEVDDETIMELVVLMGVMLGVGGAAGGITKFATNVAQAGVAKTIQRQALTKTTFYPIMKSVLRVMGVQLTKETFAKTVSKTVPIIGGAVSGGITYISFKPRAERLRKYLRALPTSGIDQSIPEEESDSKFDEILCAATEEASELASSVAGQAQVVGAAAAKQAKAAGDVLADGTQTAGAAIFISSRFDEISVETSLSGRVSVVRSGPNSSLKEGSASPASLHPLKILL